MSRHSSSLHLNLNIPEKDFGIQLTERQLQWKERRDRQKQPLQPLEKQPYNAQQQQLQPPDHSRALQPLEMRPNHLPSQQYQQQQQQQQRETTNQKEKQKELLRSMMTSKSTTTTTTTTTTSDDQKALLRKVLQKSMAKRNKQIDKDRQESVPIAPIVPPILNRTRASAVVVATTTTKAAATVTNNNNSYGSFLTVLQKEAAGDHTELWRAFRSLFGVPITKAIQSSDKVKFDAKTKQVLTEMNLHLKRSTTMECKAETQLVNDKLLQKEQKEPVPIVPIKPQPVEITKTSRNDPKVTIQNLRPERQLFPMTPLQHASTKSDPHVWVNLGPTAAITTTTTMDQDDEWVPFEALVTNTIMTPLRIPAEHIKPVADVVNSPAAIVHQPPSPLTTMPITTTLIESEIPYQTPAPPVRTKKAYDALTVPDLATLARSCNTSTTLYTVEENAVEETSSGRKRRMEQDDRVMASSQGNIDLKPTIPSLNTAPQQKMVPWSNVKLRADTKQSQAGEVTGIQWITVDEPQVMPTVEESLPIIFFPSTEKAANEDKPESVMKPKPTHKQLPSFVPPSRAENTTGDISIPWSTIRLKAAPQKPSQKKAEEPEHDFEPIGSPCKARFIPKKTAPSFIHPTLAEDLCSKNSIPWSTVKLKAAPQKHSQERTEEPVRDSEPITSPSKPRFVTKPVPSFVPLTLAEDLSGENSIPFSIVKLKDAPQKHSQEKAEEPVRDSEPITSPSKLRFVPKPVQSFVPPTLAEDLCGEYSIPFSMVKLKVAPQKSSQEKMEESVRNSEPITSPPKPRISSKPVQSFVPPTLAEDLFGENSIPWSRVKLKATTGGPGCDIHDESPAPWLQVKLRSMEHGDPESQPSHTVGEEGLVQFRHMLKNPLDEIQTTGNHSASASQRLSNTMAENKLTALCQQGDDAYGVEIGDLIDIDNLPVRVIGSEAATIIKLRVKADTPEHHSEAIIAVNSALFITWSTGDDSKSHVTWRIPRSKVQSLTLDMAENRADLSLTDGTTKRVNFVSAESCLQFASAFYGTHMAKKIDPVAPFKQGHEVTLKQHTSEDLSTERAIGEVLSKEEQEMLEKYREMRKTKAVEEALRETMPDVACPGVTNTTISSPHSILSHEDEIIAATYRKMLQLQVPWKAVEHKMNKDGVSESIRQAVLIPPASSTGSPLSPEDDKIAEAYRKMLKLLIPPHAVKSKMVKDHVDQRIVDAVFDAFSSDIPSENDSREENTKAMEVSVLTPEEEQIALKYRKMLQMMIPPDAVKHKMTKEAVDMKIVYTIFPDDAPKSAQTSNRITTIPLTDEEELVAKTYRRMRQMMIPADAVRQKMKKDNIDDKLVFVVLGPNPDDNMAKTHANALTAEEEEIASAYRKMLKMMIPPEAVRHKMQKEDVSDKIIANVLGEEKNNEKSTALESKLRGSKLVALQWTPLSGEEIDDNTIWRVNKKRRVIQQEGIDHSELEQLFQKKSNPKGGLGVLPAADAGADSKAKLIDLNRANNVAISLKAFKDFTHKELASIISHLDPNRLICGERVQFVKDMLPTVSEVKSIQNYKGLDSKLVAAELFFKELVNVKRMETKVDVMKTMDTFKENAVQLKMNFQLLSKACDQVQKSEKLQDVLEMVLHVGNIMNEGTRTGGASGFKFDSLLKLTQTKSSDGKTTVLDYMVMIFVAKEKRETLKLGDDFPDCQAASRMLISDMVADVMDMTKSFQKCKDELQNLEDDVSGLGKAASSKNETKDDPRANMFATITSRNRGGGDQKTIDSRSDLLASIKGRGEKMPTKLIKTNYARANNLKAPFDTHKSEILECNKGNNTAVFIPKCAVRNEKEHLLQHIKAKAESADSKSEVAKAVVKPTINGKNQDFKPKRSGNFLDAFTSCTNPDLSSTRSNDDIEIKSSSEPTVPEIPAIKEGTLSSGMCRLEKFIAEADVILKDLVEDKSKSLKACKDLSKYCGEKGGERVTSTLLGILSQFATNLSSAVGKHDNRKEAEARKEALAKKKPALEVHNIAKGNVGVSVQPSAKISLLVTQQRGSVVPSCSGDTSCLARNGSVSIGSSIADTTLLPSPSLLCLPSSKSQNDSSPEIQGTANKAPTNASTPAKPGDGQSLVLMVNKMLKAAPSNVKNDFAKGVVYDNPADPNLYRIYAKEQVLSGFTSPPPNQLDIMSAIEKRRERIERMKKR